MYALCTLVLVACFNLISGAQFRCDYTYYHNAKGWMKLHLEEVLYSDAVDVCNLEGGAGLVTIDNADARKVMVDLMTKNNTEKVWLTDSAQSLTRKLLTKSDFIEESPTATTPYRFICYYQAGEEVTLNECGTTDSDYKMADSANKICHKYHSDTRTWGKAFTACNTEGGNLVVVNNLQDAQRLTATKKITNKIFAGFSCNAQQKCETVNEKPLEADAKKLFAAGSPDPTGKKTCGALGNDNKLHSAECMEQLPFFCEKIAAQPCDASSKTTTTEPTTPATTTPPPPPPPTAPPTAPTPAPKASSSDRAHFAQALIITCSFYLLFK